MRVPCFTASCSPPVGVVVVALAQLKDEKDLSAVEAHLQRTIEECGLLRGLLDLSDASRKRCTGLLSSSETRVEEARVALMKLKKEQGMSKGSSFGDRAAACVCAHAEPYCPSGTPQQVMRTASSGASLSSSTQRLLGRSVADLVVQLREKGAPPELVAKHIYYAMGHRPIADDRANAVMRSALVCGGTRALVLTQMRALVHAAAARPRLTWWMHCRRCRQRRKWSSSLVSSPRTIRLRFPL